MKSHTFLGARLFKNLQSDFEEVAAEVALNHHEKWDGTGYPGHVNPFSDGFRLSNPPGNGQPSGKREEEIPLFGRIVAVADVYDALCSRRSYKEPWEEERIVEEIQRLSGRHFDPKVVDAFVQTRWAEGVADPGRTIQPRPIPLLAQHAAQGPAHAVASPPPGPGVTPGASAAAPADPR